MLKNQIERRTFIKTAALAGAALAGASVLGGCSKASTDTGKWDKTADVVIVGGGGTGLAAAVEAAAAGASVLVLEKGVATGGTTALSGGVIQAAGTSYQKKFTKYQDDTAEKHFQTWKSMGEGLVNDDLIKDQTAAMAGHIDWLVAQGLEFVSVYGHCHTPYLDKTAYFADRIHVYKGGGAAMGGKPLTDALVAAAKKKGATIEVETEVTKLIIDAKNGVIGVEAKNGSGTIRVKANKGVVIATASIDRNKAMSQALCPQQYWDNTTQMVLVAETNTGDGIRMGMEIGADVVMPGGTIDFCGVTYQGTSDAAPQLTCIYVNGQGQRFVCEDATYAYMYRAIYQQNVMWQAPTYMILDADAAAKGPTWGGDALAAAVKSGALVKADTVEALAAAIKVPAANLVATLARWNAIVKTGKDVDYQRNTQILPIAKAPFYAYKQVSFNLGSIGGLKINVDTQVIDVNGTPIPRLYAGGLAAGGWIGPYYPGSGTAVGGCVHWGRKAGASAAKNAAWA